MEYQVDIAGFEGRQLVLKSSGFFSGPKLLIDGQPAPKGAKRGDLVLRRNDGTEVVAQLKTTNFLDPVPQIVIGGQQIEVVEPLKWYQWVWSGAPIILLFVGGLLGGLAGGAAVVINGRIFRTEMNEALKYVATGAVAVCATIAYLVLATLFGMLIGGM